MNTTLGKRISTLRREKELKQDELAEKLGVSSQAVSKWENDQTCPDISLLPLLANIFNISVDELLTGEKAESPSVKFLPESERKSIDDMMLRIVMTNADKDVVKINLPLPVIKALMENGVDLSYLTKNESIKTILINMIDQGAIGNIIEVDSFGGDKIQIWVE
jgi:transcriptional regulator with XRE-family HTH domain